MVATGVIYAGGERTARRLPLIILAASYITSLVANVMIIVVRDWQMLFQSFIHCIVDTAELLGFFTRS